MKTKIRKLKGGSLLKGELPKGCKFCRRGAKLFFFLTGKCCESCFYCSLARIKRGKDLILANERPVSGFAGVMIEISNMDAQGAAITGGDPLVALDLTLKYINKMKKQYGKNFHIHLYTSGRFATEANLEQLAQVGLDEIRFHPQNQEHEKAIERALNYEWTVGAEVPVLPDEKGELLRFLDYLDSLEEVAFCNLNELEATEANIENLKKRGYKIKNEISSAVVGSKELALEVLKTTELSLDLHFCSARSKDTVQFRNRLIRTAEIVRKPFEEIRDGMLVKATINLPPYLISEELVDILIDEYEVEPEMLDLSDEQTIETSWYIADVLKDVLFNRFEIEDINITVEYPTYGRIKIAQTSLKKLAEEQEDDETGNPFIFYFDEE
ncbi:MAG: radical SAM protein [Candidatus Heimdallarchaeota archaeon]|nr:radical SAM protein [Candidatus Heimdallarchaeota archaeon]